MPRTLSAAVVTLVLILAACGGSSAAEGTREPGPASPSSSTGKVELDVGTNPGTELTFDPATVTAPAGASVVLTFENRSTVPHNLKFIDPITAATSNVVSPGASETVEFLAPGPGSYAFVCTLHPGMTGTLAVD